MVFASDLVASDSQVDILGFNLVKKGEYTVASDDLPIEIVGFKSLQLRIAEFAIDFYVFILAELFEFFSIDVRGRVETLTVTLIATVTEKISVNV